MFRILIVGCAVALAMVTAPATAKMYKCVDGDGNVTYSQTQCPETESIEQVREQAPPPSPSVVPVIGSDGKRYYVESDSIEIESRRPDDYYSPANQAKRMKQESDARLEKKLTKERRAQNQRDYQKAIEANQQAAEESREGRCKYYQSMARTSRYSKEYYRARAKQYCD